MNQINLKKGFAAVATVAVFSALTLVVLLLGLFARPEQLKNTPANASPVVVSTITKPSADTMVRKENPDRNYGTNPTLVVKGKDERMVFMKFDLNNSQVDSTYTNQIVISAKLRLKTTREGGSKAKQAVAALENKTWQETALTYNNTLGGSDFTLKPGAVIASLPQAKSNTWIQTDVTAAVKQAVMNGNIFSIAVIAVSNENGDGLSFYSKESVVDQPELVIEYAPVVTPTMNVSGNPTSPAYSCKDSDNGRDFAVAGYTQIRNGDMLEIRRDNCARLKNSEYIQTSVCTGDDCYVVEQICEMDRPNSITAPCIGVCNAGACISATPTPAASTPTPGGVSTTPYPQACEIYKYMEPPKDLKPFATGFVNPAEPVVFSWSSVPRAVKYAIRIDDLTDGFEFTYTGSTCRATNPNDICLDGLTSATFKNRLQAGHWYRWWVHAIDSCNNWSTSQSVDFRIVAPSLTPTPTAGTEPTSTPAPNPTFTPTPTSYR